MIKRYFFNFCKVKIKFKNQIFGLYKHYINLNILGLYNIPKICLYKHKHFRFIIGGNQLI